MIPPSNSPSSSAAVSNDRQGSTTIDNDRQEETIDKDPQSGSTAGTTIDKTTHCQIGALVSEGPEISGLQRSWFLFFVDRCRSLWILGDRFFLIQIGGLLLAIGVVFALSSRYPLIDWIGAAQDRVEHLGFWSGLIYPIVYAGCNLLLLPGGVLGMAGGFFFGLWWGFILVLAGNLIGAGAAFRIARKIGRQRVERLLHQSRRLQLFDSIIARHSWKIILLSQLSPLAPTSLLNYFYGLSKVRLSRCLIWIAIGQTPGLFLYTFIGTLSQYTLEMARGVRTPFAHEYWIWGGGFVLTIVTTLLLGRLAKRILAEVESQISPES